MKNISKYAALVLAIPLLVFGSNYFLDFIPMMPDDGSSGYKMLTIMREGGIMVYVAISHIIIGLMLLIPKTRFIAALLQLPISIGIVLFHVSMQPAGAIIGLILLLLNVLALVNKGKWNGVLGDEIN